jgi:hypothetical protein
MIHNVPGSTPQESGRPDAQVRWSCSLLPSRSRQLGTPQSGNTMCDGTFRRRGLFDIIDPAPLARHPLTSRHPIGPLIYVNDSLIYVNDVLKS